MKKRSIDIFDLINFFQHPDLESSFSEVPDSPDDDSGLSQW